MIYFSIKLMPYISACCVFDCWYNCCLHPRCAGQCQNAGKKKENIELGLKMFSMQVQREKLLAREALFESELKASKERNGGGRKTSMASFGKR